MWKERIPKIIKSTLACDKTKVSHFTEYDSAYPYDSEENALTLVSSRMVKRENRLGLTLIEKMQWEYGTKQPERNDGPQNKRSITSLKRIDFDGGEVSCGWMDWLLTVVLASEIQMSFVILTAISILGLESGGLSWVVTAVARLKMEIGAVETESLLVTSPHLTACALPPFKPSK
ncbi:hypothetical protein VNO78_07772 [Psophocarpus tetragonolobus]|uniref:Uncharacterized protein n=1 Tax=Psophocarpus tetragonolobus TaxID=3891 RepID=A0AAN9T3R9_PSOTE